MGNYDWVKMFFIDKDTDEYTYEAVTFLLNGSINNSVKNIQAMSIGNIGAYDKQSNGYYMVEFSSSSYTLQEYKTIDRQIIKPDELISNGRYFNSTV